MATNGDGPEATRAKIYDYPTGGMMLIPIIDQGAQHVITKDGRVWAFKDHKRTWRMTTDSKLGLAVEVLTISEQEGR